MRAGAVFQIQPRGGRAVFVFPDRFPCIRCESNDDFLIALAVHRVQRVTASENRRMSCAEWARPQLFWTSRRPRRSESFRGGREVAVWSTPLQPVTLCV